MPRLSKEERVFVVEKYFERFKHHFGNDLIMHHLAKGQFNKTLKNTFHLEQV